MTTQTLKMAAFEHESDSMVNSPDLTNANTEKNTLWPWDSSPSRFHPEVAVVLRFGDASTHIMYHNVSIYVS